VKVMDGIWGQGRARGYGVTALLAVLVFGGSATAADALRSSSNQQPTGDVFVTPAATPSATPTLSAAPAAPTSPPAPALEPAVTQAPSVQTVTTPAPKAAATTEGAIVDPQSIGTTDEHGNYTPAPPIVHPGEPPVGPPTAPATITPLEGEPGYTGPVLTPQNP
jgi:hypothetical protein